MFLEQLSISKLTIAISDCQCFHLLLQFLNYAEIIPQSCREFPVGPA